MRGGTLPARAGLLLRSGLPFAAGLVRCASDCGDVASTEGARVERVLGEGASITFNDSPNFDRLNLNSRDTGELRETLLARSTDLCLSTERAGLRGVHTGLLGEPHAVLCGVQGKLLAEPRVGLWGV